ncbi:NUDIX hydrolase [Lichenibacterium minor]|uniref:NUDIX hydrolase n=1 Tax=Lichenibacterium minor TaxID=2316528 RepID=A0A4Q2U1Y2_9HYPH|nr:NUDIX domain-containing protein [Lichenibacterium minor]RYC30312.1 NUDIX hydrolase [Lichenibacterium minor]
MPNVPRKPRKQVAALPVMVDPKGQVRVLLITSRETQRFIIPKGWPMKGRKDHHAAAIEAQQEAGIIGRVHKQPVGGCNYWKRRSDHFDYCRVKVFMLEFRYQLPDWRERGQRRGAWLPVDDAADLVDDPGLIDIIRTLPKRLATKHKRLALKPATMS